MFHDVRTRAWHRVSLCETRCPVILGPPRGRLAPTGTVRVVSVQRCRGVRAAWPAGCSRGGTYDDANRLTTRGTTTYSYDDVGNMTSNGTQTFVWDPRGQLTQITGGPVPASFVYDATGRRRQAIFNATRSSFLSGARGYKSLHDLCTFFCVEEDPYRSKSDG